MKKESLTIQALYMNETENFHRWKLHNTNPQIVGQFYTSKDLILNQLVIDLEPKMFASRAKKGRN